MLQTLINPLRTNHRPHNLSDAWRSDKNQHRQHNKSNPLSLQNEPAQQKKFVWSSDIPNTSDNPENPGYETEIFPE